MLRLDTRKLLIFACGVLFGTAGIKMLGSKDAKKVYVNCVAAGLRAKDCCMKAVTTVQENAEDVLAEAKELNQEKYGIPNEEAGAAKDAAEQGA